MRVGWQITEHMFMGVDASGEPILNSITKEVKEGVVRDTVDLNYIPHFVIEKEDGHFEVIPVSECKALKDE